MPNNRPNSKSFVPIGTVLNELLPQFRRTTSPALLAVWEIWESCVDPEIARHCKPVAFKGSMLLVHVSSSAWLHHLRFTEKKLIDDLNRALGAEEIRVVKFKVGSI